jgi:hypothetical protein
MHPIGINSNEILTLKDFLARLIKWTSCRAKLTRTEKTNDNTLYNQWPQQPTRRQSH